MREIELVRTAIEPPPPGASRPVFDGLPDYQRHAGSNWDFDAATQFALLFFLGLRQDHYLLDIGCGSLRAGRLFIPYLLPGHYHGIEPHQWTIDVALAEELGADLLRIRRPVLSNDAGFNLSAFGRRFDFLLAHSIFTHTTQAQVRKCLTEAAGVLEPEGIFATTYAEGPDYTGGEWAWPNCITYQPATLARFVEEVGLAASHLDWPLYCPKQHRLLLISPSGDRLARCVKARQEGKVTTWAI